jgi:hypothetical protein
MSKPLILCLAVCSLLLVSFSTAEAQVYGGNYTVVQSAPPPVLVVERPRRPSLFASGYRGLLSGALVGASTGYLIGRPGGFHGQDYRNLAFASGVGALIGAGAGVGVGLIDLGSDYGRAHVIVRDTLYGTVFGTLTGAIAGGLSVIKSGDGEHAMLGTTIGAISGAGLGLIVGIIDSLVYPVAGCGARPCQVQARRYVPGVGATADAGGNLVVTPGIAGRF